MSALNIGQSLSFGQLKQVRYKGYYSKCDQRIRDNITNALKENETVKDFFNQHDGVITVYAKEKNNESFDDRRNATVKIAWGDKPGLFGRYPESLKFTTGKIHELNSPAISKGVEEKISE